jgi:hypothetical protein
VLSSAIGSPLLKALFSKRRIALKMNFDQICL